MSIDDEPKNLGGRPRIEIDMDQLKAACQIQCTAEECAALFDCSVDTIDLRLKEDGWAGFTEFYKRHSENGRSSLRRMQWATARAGNPTMQIWLGKQTLGQSDRQEVDHRFGLIKDVDGVDVVAGDGTSQD